MARNDQYREYLGDRARSSKELPGKMFAAMTGRATADVTGRGSVRDMLMAAFGPSQTDANRPDTAAAAKALKVSQRTVQRWVASGHQQRPRPTTLANIAKRARQAASTKAGRARAAAQAFGKGKAPKGMRVNVRGAQGLQPGPDYVRPDRWAHFDLDDPNLSRDFVNAWVDGGDKAAMAWLAQNSEDAYQVPSWYFEDVTFLSIEGEYGRD